MSWNICAVYQIWKSYGCGTTQSVSTLSTDSIASNCFLISLNLTALLCQPKKGKNVLKWLSVKKSFNQLLNKGLLRKRKRLRPLCWQAIRFWILIIQIKCSLTQRMRIYSEQCSLYAKISTNKVLKLSREILTENLQHTIENNSWAVRDDITEVNKYNGK